MQKNNRVELFKYKCKISSEDIKGKYLKDKKLELRNKFIQEVLKYKAINQVELGGVLSISSHLASKEV